MAVKKQNTFNEINITPLTDIFLVLLIIMMVIAPLLDQQGLNLAVPQLGAPENQKKDHKFITVDLDSHGKILVDGTEITKDTLLDKLKEAFQVKKDGLVIQAEPDAQHQHVVVIMDAARTAGIENVSLMSKGEGTPAQ